MKMTETNRFRGVGRFADVVRQGSSSTSFVRCPKKLDEILVSENAVEDHSLRTALGENGRARNLPDGEKHREQTAQSSLSVQERVRTATAESTGNCDAFKYRPRVEEEEPGTTQ